MPDYSSQSDFQLILDGGLGVFATSDAIEVSGESKDVFDGGSTEPYVLGGRATGKDFTVTRPFARDRDMSVYREWLPKINQAYANAQLFPTDRQLLRSGSYFAGRALVKGIWLPEYKADTVAAPTETTLQLRLRVAVWRVV